MTVVALINLSEEVSSQDYLAMAQALQDQVRQDAQPRWKGHGRLWDTEVSIVACRTLAEAPAGSLHLLLVDGLDVLGAYGYHDVDPKGQPYGRVDVRECLAGGGSVLRGTNCPSSCASHELLELLGDPDVSWWVMRPDGFRVPGELSDAVQGFTYSREACGKHVDLSDFVLPAYFVANHRASAEADPNVMTAAGEKLDALMKSAKHSFLLADDASDEEKREALLNVLSKRHSGPYDFLGKLSAPFEIAPGGYSILMDSHGHTKNVFGSRELALRPSKYHPTSRTTKRSRPCISSPL